MAWIKRDDQDHTAYLVTVTWSRTGHGGLSDSPRSINIVLEPKSQKRNLVQWSIHEVVIHSKLGGGIEFKVITTFSSVRRPSKCTYCPLQGLAYNSVSLKNASAFCFRMESLESWAGGFISSHTQTQAKKLMLFTSVLWGFN